MASAVRERHVSQRIAELVFHQDEPSAAVCDDELSVMKWPASRLPVLLDARVGRGVVRLSHANGRADRHALKSEARAALATFFHLGRGSAPLRPIPLLSSAAFLARVALPALFRITPRSVTAGCAPAFLPGAIPCAIWRLPEDGDTSTAAALPAFRGSQFHGSSIETRLPS